MKSILASVGVISIVTFGLIAALLPLADEKTETGATIISVLAAATSSILIFISVAIYVLPTLVATGRHDHHAFDITVLNIFAGWTIVGWAAALIWSLIDSANSRGSTAILPVAK